MAAPELQRVHTGGRGGRTGGVLSEEADQGVRPGPEERDLPRIRPNIRALVAPMWTLQRHTNWSHKDDAPLAPKSEPGALAFAASVRTARPLLGDPAVSTRGRPLQSGAPNATQALPVRKRTWHAAAEAPCRPSTSRSLAN